MIRTSRRYLCGATPERQSIRQLHLSSEGAVELLRRRVAHVTTDKSVDEVYLDSKADAITIRFSASRQLNVPIIEGSKKNGLTAQLKLDISDDGLPPTLAGWIIQLGVPIEGRETLVNAVQQLWQTFLQNDLLRLSVEVQPGEQTTISKPEVIADDFALHKHPELRYLANESLLHPLEGKAAKGKLFYHKSRDGGNIGCYGYGAGVAMSTMDALVAAGGKPANFLDGGGGATEANVRAAMEVLLSDPDLEVILINSFGGLTKTNLIAAGVVKVVREYRKEGKAVPRMVVRLRGTGEAEAREILSNATDLEGIEYVEDLKSAAAKAVQIASSHTEPAISSSTSHSSDLPVIFSRDGQYESTLANIRVKENDPVMILGVGKASHFHNKVAQDYGTNIVGSTAPKKGGQIFLDRPVFGSVREGVDQLRPRIASVFVPPQAAAESIIECIEAEIPLVVAFAEGIPTKDQLIVQRALRSQSKTRLIGANCPGIIFPHQKVKLGIQPLNVHTPGYIGLASRSGTISYELASQTSNLGLGQSVVFGLGGDPFPGTRTWEALRFMLDDPLTKVICLVGEIGGQMEEEAAFIYEEYINHLATGARSKPVVGFIAGQSTQRGLMYGHAGAIWWDEQETAEAKKRRWTDAGFVVAPTLGDVGGLLREEAVKLGLVS